MSIPLVVLYGFMQRRKQDDGRLGRPVTSRKGFTPAMSHLDQEKGGYAGSSCNATWAALRQNPRTPWLQPIDGWNPTENTPVLFFP